MRRVVRMGDYSFFINAIPHSPGRISMKQLADRIGCDERQVRSYVLAARINGELIGSDTSGYFIPVTDQELIDYYRTARRRAMATLRSLKVVRKRLAVASVHLRSIEGRS